MSTLRPYSARNSHHPITYALKTHNRENLTYINHGTWLEEPVKFYQNARWSLFFPVWMLFYNRNTTKSHGGFTPLVLSPSPCDSQVPLWVLLSACTAWREHDPILPANSARSKGCESVTSLTSPPQGNHHLDFIDITPPRGNLWIHWP